MTDAVNASQIKPARLVDFAAAVYAGEGVPEADTRVQADLWGHQDLVLPEV